MIPLFLDEGDCDDLKAVWYIQCSGDRMEYIGGVISASIGHAGTP